MDPALQELMAEGGPDDEVAVVVRLHHGANPPAALRLVTRFGTIATGRAQRGALRALHADPAIASLKAPREYARELDAVHGAGEADGPPDAAPDDVRRPPDLPETGRGTVVCVIDWSLDYAHPDFRRSDGGTRLLGLWDQRGAAMPANRYGYGRIHRPAAIDHALAQHDPFAALDYTPAANAHGTHVLGIAAGNGRAGGPQGIAPEAGLIFVHLGNGGGDLGNSIELLEGIDFAVRTAGDQPLVINLSLGRHAGPHDGTLLIERAIDWLLINRPGTAVVQSAGNYYSRDVHMAGRISETRSAQLPFRMKQRDAVPVSVEIWYNGADEFAARMRGPGGAVAIAALGDNTPVRLADGREIGYLYHRRADPNNGDNLINLFLRREAAAGVWEIEIEGIDVVDGRWHAWIERNAACRPCQAQFRHDLAEPQNTTGSICNAMRTIAVGAYDGHDPAHPLPDFSSVGPTRDGRRKPLLAAPGVRVLSVRSRADASAAPGYLRMSGTSMAAPHVTGTLALMMQAAGRQRVTALRRALFATLAPAGADDPRWGYGQLAITEAVTRARALPPPVTAPLREGESMADDLVNTAIELLQSGMAVADFPHALAGEPPLAMLRRALDPDDRSIGVVGWRGQRLTGALRQGDVLLRHGPTRAPRLAVIADPTPLGATAMRRLGVVTEGPLPGSYVRVIEPGASGPAGFARRIAGPDGLMLHDTVILRHAEAGETVMAPPGTHPMIRRGSSGPAVSEAQAKLNRVHAKRVAAAQSGIDRCPLAVDGIFGQNTGGATLSFQKIAFPGQPSEWDSVIGPKTWAMLDAFARDDAPPDIPPRIPPIIPPIIPIANVVLQPERWLRLLGTRNNAPITTQNAVKALVDGRATYASMAADIAAAKGDKAFIYLLGWDIYDNFPLLTGDCASTLGALLSDADTRGVQIRAMIWDNITKPRKNNDDVARINALAHGGGIIDARNGGAVPITKAQVEAIMTAAAGAMSLATLDPDIKREWEKIRDDVTQRLQGIKAAHHQKVLVIFTGERLIAYCGGLDLNPNRVPPDITSCGTGDHGPILRSDPQHDTHCRIVGPAARELLRTFVDRWMDHPSARPIDTAKGALLGEPVGNIPAPQIPNPSPVDAPFGGSCSVVIARTWTPVKGSTRPPKQRDIRDLLLVAIANAQRFIYIEDQYMIDIATANALNRVIDRLSHITIVIPGNEITSLGFPQFYRQQFINAVIAGKSPEIADKLQVFQLNKPRGSAPNSFGRESYCHSKCWVIDDELAVIGSANCNRRGYQHDSEVDAFIFDDAISSPPLIALAARGENAEISGSGLTFAQQFRMRLWAEHLGVPAPTDGTDVSAWPGFSSLAVPNPLLGVARFDPVHPPHSAIVNRAIAIVAPPLLDLIDPASP
ncbi:MAG TPA: S8 family serine peptidase [Sphingomonas sp.]|nr:S8 family serine peptidase [Sphingomonas sp.]